MFVEFTSKFSVKVSLSGYISPITHQKAFIIGPWVLWRVCFISMSLCPGLCPGFTPQGGAGGKKRAHLQKCFTNFLRGARWLSGRVSDSGARGRGFQTYLRRVVSLSKTLYSPKVLVNCPPPFRRKAEGHCFRLSVVRGAWFRIFSR